MPASMPDRPLNAPRLAEMAANVFASQLSLLGEAAYKKSNNSVISWDNEVLTLLPKQLSKEVAQEIFDALRRKWDQRDVSFCQIFSNQI